jgi:stage IV sporulation protein B
LKDQEIYNMKDPLSIEPQSQGNISLNLKLLGIIPIKQINVSVTSQKSLIPGGNSIGVSLYTKGALVVGTSEVVDRLGIAHYPAMEAGLLPGDVIESVNGITVNDANHLSQLINKAKGKGVDLECRRGNHLFITSIEPVKDANDDKYRLGLWVRDSTAGVGTLTFYDPQTRYFGALGHAITDVDTGALLMVKGGEIMQSQIMDIKIGKKGLPGELVGNFTGNRKVLGSIIKNTTFGIYGKMSRNLPDFYYDKAMPIANRHNVKPGKASILTTIDDRGIQEYDIEIVKVNQQTVPSAKGLVIKITDPVLLEKTGGIVQGMSGSPILQNGRIVGAVTHVFVNDPQKGYGIFIEWMLAEANKIIE